MSALLCLALLVTPLSWDIYGYFLLLPCAILWRAGKWPVVLLIVALLYLQHQGPRFVAWGVPAWALVFQPLAYVVAAAMTWRLRREDRPGAALHCGGLGHQS